MIYYSFKFWQVSTLCDEDVVCKQCDTSIKFCVDFIDNCLKVENELLNEYEEEQDEFRGKIFIFLTKRMKAFNN